MSSNINAPTTPQGTAPRRTAPHRTAPRRTAPQETGFSKGEAICAQAGRQSSQSACLGSDSSAAAVNTSDFSGSGAGCTFYGGTVASGCGNAAGFSGGITPTTALPFYIGSFAAVECPPHSTGLVHDMCTPDKGYSGQVIPAKDYPFYVSTLAPVGCPPGSVASDISTAYPRGTLPTGCEPVAGFSGTVLATAEYPFFISTVALVDCPGDRLRDGAFVIATTGTVAGGFGTGGTSNCTTAPGWAGFVVATTVDPYYDDSALQGRVSLSHVRFSSRFESEAPSTRLPCCSVCCSAFRYSCSCHIRAHGCVW